MNIFDIFAAASFEYAVYSNLAATDLCPLLASPGSRRTPFALLCVGRRVAPAGLRSLLRQGLRLRMRPG